MKFTHKFNQNIEILNSRILDILNFENNVSDVDFV